MPAWTPPASQPTDATDGTLAQTIHAQRHNNESAAINAIVSMLGADPTQGAATLTAYLASPASDRKVIPAPIAIPEGSDFGSGPWDPETDPLPGAIPIPEGQFVLTYVADDVPAGNVLRHWTVGAAGALVDEVNLLSLDYITSIVVASGDVGNGGNAYVKIIRTTDGTNFFPGDFPVPASVIAAIEALPTTSEMGTAISAAISAIDYSGLVTDGDLTAALAGYQPSGSYQPAGSYATSSELADLSDHVDLHHPVSLAQVSWIMDCQGLVNPIVDGSTNQPGPDVDGIIADETVMVIDPLDPTYSGIWLSKMGSPWQRPAGLDMPTGVPQASGDFLMPRPVSIGYGYGSFYHDLQPAHTMIWAKKGSFPFAPMRYVAFGGYFTLEPTHQSRRLRVIDSSTTRVELDNVGVDDSVWLNHLDGVVLVKDNVVLRLPNTTDCAKLQELKIIVADGVTVTWQTSNPHATINNVDPVPITGPAAIELINLTTYVDGVNPPYYGWWLSSEAAAAAGPASAAEDVSYDNGVSGLTATDIQAAVDEVWSTARAVEGSGNEIGGVVSSPGLQLSSDARSAVLTNGSAFPLKLADDSRFPIYVIHEGTGSTDVQKQDATPLVTVDAGETWIFVPLGSGVWRSVQLV